MNSLLSSFLFVLIVMTLYNNKRIPREQSGKMNERAMLYLERERERQKAKLCKTLSRSIIKCDARGYWPEQYVRMSGPGQ